MAKLVLDGVRSSSSNGLSVDEKQVTPRAWTTFSPQSTSPSIGRSFNVSSIVKLGSGDADLRWRLYFTRPMPDDDFVALYTCGSKNNTTFDGNMVNVVELTSTYVSVVQAQGNGSRLGRSYGAIVVFR